MRLNSNAILEKAESGGQLNADELCCLLELANPRARERLFAAARRVRRANFGDEVFLYGFVYFSTYCRNGCSFCYFRQSNGLPERYRKTADEIVQSSVRLARSGVHLIDLTMGEDPHFLCDGERGYARLCSLVSSVKRATGLPVMISPGVVTRQGLLMLRAAGADFYACYQETHNREIFKTLRLGQDYDERMQAKLSAQDAGLLIEEGLLSGVGGGAIEVANSIEQIRLLDADQMRTMSFVPQAGTPLAGTVTAGDALELNTIAVMRLAFPDRLIPASLDVEGACGLAERLNAGANVVTSLIPPSEGLMGVSQSTLDVDDGRRTAEGIEPILRSCGLRRASQTKFADYLAGRRYGGKRAAAR